MNTSIKTHILNNFKGATIEEIRSSIDASVNDKDEITLPGLGVFFNLVWGKCNNEEKINILNKLKDSF